jgi:hypothetical protein
MQEIKREIRRGVRSTVYFGCWHQTDVEIRIPQVLEMKQADKTAHGDAKACGKAAEIPHVTNTTTAPPEKESLATAEPCKESVKYIEHEVNI